MKKMILGSVAALVLAVVAAEVSLGWVFEGYSENIAASSESAASTVDTTLAVTAEAELDISSFPCGTMLIFR